MKDGSGVFWTGMEKVFLQGVGFAQGVLLARLLTPHDFGLVAMLGLFLCVGNDLAESGLGTAYVVYGGNERKMLAWNVGIGLGIYGLMALGAPFVASFYGQPILKPLLWTMGAGVVLNAACALGNARLQRGRLFRRLSVINCVTALCAFAVAVTLAWCGMGVWSIALMGLFAAGLRLGQLTLATRGLSPSAEQCPIGKLLSYGWKLTLSGLIHTVYMNCHQLVIGKLFAPTAVGLYTRGQRWASLPDETVNGAVMRVALPSLAEGTSSPRRYLAMTCLLLWPGLAVLGLFAEEIVRFVLGEAWVDCVPYLRILLVGVVFSPFANVALSQLRAKGRGDLILFTDAIKKPLQILALAVGCAAIVLGGAKDGLAFLCWTKVFGDLVEAAVDCIVVRRVLR